MWHVPCDTNSSQKFTSRFVHAINQEEIDAQAIAGMISADRHPDTLCNTPTGLAVRKSGTYCMWVCDYLDGE